MNKLLACAIMLGQVLSCPIGDSLLKKLDNEKWREAVLKAHPELQRRLTAVDEDPPLPDLGGPDKGGGTHGGNAKNAFIRPPLAATMAPDLTMIDLVAMFQMAEIPMEWGTLPQIKEDLCVWSFQSLPPPPSANTARVDHGHGEYFQYPINDLQKLVDLCDMAADRLSSKIVDGGPVVLAGCAFGKIAAQALCSQNITGQEGSYCGATREQAEISWPQSITMFKITPHNMEELKTIMQNWRNKESEHLPNIYWVTAGGSNITTSGMSPAHNAGWGTQGGLRAKVLPCSHIDSKFKYPTTKMGGDYVEPGKTKTFWDEAFEHWESLCSIPVGGGVPDSCSQALLERLMQGPNISKPETPKIPKGDLFPPPAEKCMTSPAYQTANLQCGTSLQRFWGDDSAQQTYEMFLHDNITTCYMSFCEKLSYSNGKVPYIDKNTDITTCVDDKGVETAAPKNCQQAGEYMTALSSLVQCRNRAFLIANYVRTWFVENSGVNTTASKGCMEVDECERKTQTALTPEWGIDYCINFVQAVTDPYFNETYTKENPNGFDMIACGYDGDGSAGTGLRTKCMELVKEVQEEQGEEKDKENTPAPMPAPMPTPMPMPAKVPTPMPEKIPTPMPEKIPTPTPEKMPTPMPAPSPSAPSEQASDEAMCAATLGMATLLFSATHML